MKTTIPNATGVQDLNNAGRWIYLRFRWRTAWVTFASLSCVKIGAESRVPVSDISSLILSFLIALKSFRAQVFMPLAIIVQLFKKPGTGEELWAPQLFGRSSDRNWALFHELFNFCIRFSSYKTEIQGEINTHELFVLPSASKRVWDILINKPAVWSIF